MQAVNEDDLYEKNCNYMYVDMRELNGLSLVYAMARSIWRQAITQINADVYCHLDPWNKIRWNFDQNTYIMSNQENADEKSSAKWQSFFSDTSQTTAPTKDVTSICSVCLKN